MLCNGEKLGLMFPSANEWPQQKMGEKILMSENNNTTCSTFTSKNNGSANSSDNGERPSATAAQNHQASLKCPRCDSSNTKFCYYNNYSLSQPRHFCKACKRYWTRGGTLRNVPVGGGCRKNKRVKKPSTAAVATPSASVAMAHNPISHHPSINPANHMASLSLPTSASDHLDPSMFYALHAGGISSNLSNGSPIIPSYTTTAFDLQPQLSALGLGFSSSNHRDDEFPQLWQLPVTSSKAMFDNSLFGSSVPSATTVSLLVSSLKNSKNLEDYQASVFPYDDLQASGLNLGMFKDAKLEGQTNPMNNNGSCSDQWQITSDCGAVAGTFSSLAPNDSTYLYWNAAMNTGGVGWQEPSNCSSSVAPPLR